MQKVATTAVRSREWDTCHLVQPKVAFVENDSTVTAIADDDQ